MMRSFLCLLTLALLMLTSCGGKQPAAEPRDDQAADSAAVAYYQLQASGQFEAYVAAMQSCRRATSAYRQRMIDMLRQHQVQINQDKGGVREVKALRSEKNAQGTMANVFLSVTYGDGSREEVLFPLVSDGGRWLIQ